MNGTREPSGRSAIASAPAYRPALPQRHRHRAFVVRQRRAVGPEELPVSTHHESNLFSPGTRPEKRTAAWSLKPVMRPSASVV